MFIAGIPQRSGTTALTRYLNLHPEILICNERYRFDPRKITPEHFTFERILDYRDRETKIPREHHVELLQKKDPAKLKWIGDKRPAYFNHYEALWKNNLGTHFIVMFRPVEDVAESFQNRAERPRDPWPHVFEDGVQRWNSALRLTRVFVESRPNPPILVLPYHDFFYDNEVCVPLVQRFLGVEFGETVRGEWERMSRGFEGRRRSKKPLSKEQESFVRENKDFENEQWMLDFIERQFAGSR